MRKIKVRAGIAPKPQNVYNKGDCGGLQNLADAPRHRKGKVFMPRFFTTAVQWDETAQTGAAVLDGEDGRHIARALRMRPGEAVTLCDGAGFDFDGTIESIAGDTVSVRILQKKRTVSEPTLRVTLYPGMPKADKLELVVQKATELGVAAICPTMTARCVSRPDAKAAQKKQERLGRIALEAAKQSGRGAVPRVLPLTDFRDAVCSAKGAKILFYEGGGAPLSTCVPAGETEVSIFIGPEGGFDAEEVAFARAHGAVAATLGPRILRTETAPLAALAILMFMTGNME